VYLVTEATTQDLQSFTKDAASPDESGETAGESSGSDYTGGIPAPDADTDILIDGGVLPSKDRSHGDDGKIIVDVDGSPGTGEESGGDGQASVSGQSPDGDGKTEESGKKASPIPGWIIIILILFLAAFAGYMFLVVLPRKKAKEAFMENEDEADEDEYLEETYAVEPNDMQKNGSEEIGGDTELPGDDVSENPADDFITDDED